MPSKKRRRDDVSTTRSSPPTKRQRINHQNVSTTSTRKSKRIQMRRERTLNSYNTKNPTNIKNGPLRRSKRIKEKMSGSITTEHKEQSLEGNDNNDLNDITDSMRDNLSLSPQRVEPALAPQTQHSNLIPSNNYIHLRNRMEIGLITAYDFRRIILDNELNNFYFRKQDYSLQSILPIFDHHTHCTDKKINAFTLHDNELFAFSGTKDGHIGITNFTKIPYETSIVHSHKEKITDIRTTAKRPLHLYTSSQDGTVKILDLTRVPTWQLNEDSHSFFGDTVIDNDKVMIHGIDIKNSGREILAVDHNGMLLYCDVRTHSNYQYQIAEKKIPTIRIHPISDHYFVIGDNNYGSKSIQLFDFRKIRNNKMSCVHKRKFKNVCVTLNWSSNGERLLSSGRDDNIRVYDNPLYTFNKDVISMHHNNNTGIWICDFQPVFHPKYCEIVLTGNLEQKGIDLLYFGRDHKTRKYNVHDLTKVRGVHSFGAVHSRFNDYLFGVTYDKLVFYANISSDEQL